MKLVQVDREFIKKTVEWWQNHTYATHGDIFRVEAFRSLDANTATFDDVSAAYGGTGWASLTPCVECGDTEHTHVKFGGVEVCQPCVDNATSLLYPIPQEETPAPKKSIFSFWS